MKATIDEIIQKTAFVYNKKKKVFIVKRRALRPFDIDLMISLALISGDYEDERGCVFI